MIPFESLDTLSYSYSIVTIYIIVTCLISEIKRDIGRKSFFYRATRTHRWQDVCPSVCSPVIRRYSVDIAEHIFKFFLPPGSPTILISPHQIPYQNGMSTYRRDPLTGVSNARGYEQELSYRKQIARQLRTQYVEGIYRPKYYTVTLKSKLRVTQGH